MSREQNKKVWTVSELISWGTNYLNDYKIESPRLSIELLLCEILSCTRLDLYLNYDKPLNPRELKELKSKIKALLCGKPLQFVLGWTQFLNYKIFLCKKVFIPRPETEILVKFALDKYKNRKEEPLSILDIGCGSGAISIALADFFKNSKVLAIDVDKDAIEQTKENAERHSLKNIQLHRMDILKEVPSEKFDLIVSNPPYIPILEYYELPKHVLDEPKLALTDGSDGLTFYKRFAEIFPKILNESGNFFLEVGWNQAEAVAEIFANSGFDVDIKKDFQGIKRIVYSNRFLNT